MPPPEHSLYVGAWQRMLLGQSASALHGAFTQYLRSTVSHESGGHIMSGLQPPVHDSYCSV
jgi:hypothetical protein